MRVKSTANRKAEDEDRNDAGTDTGPALKRGIECHRMKKQIQMESKTRFICRFKPSMEETLSVQHNMN